MQKPNRPRFAIFGGSFNPIHQGHIDVVRGVMDCGAVDHLLVVPANRSPFKDEPNEIPPGIRLEMVRRALAGIPGVSVSDFELRRPPPSYTIDTLVAFRGRYPNGRFSLIMGWDAFQGFPGWRDAAAILEWAGLMVIGREGDPGLPSDDPAEWISCLPPEWQERVSPEGGKGLRDRQGKIVVEQLRLTTTPISSTRIRQERRLDAVPAAARGVLSAHWAESPPPDASPPEGAKPRPAVGRGPAGVEP